MITTRITAITVNWNKPQDTCVCVDLLLKQTGYEPSVILVDNGSDDDSINIFREKYNNFPVKLLELNENIGFAGGYNAGINYALRTTTEYILIINNDTIPSVNLLQALIQPMDVNIGVTAPVIYYADEPTRIWSMGGDISPIFLEPLNAHNRNKPIPTQPTPRTFLSGCVMLIKRQVMEDVGIFDKQFFAYYEDLDLCMRINKTGIKMLLAPNAEVYHKVSLSSDGSNSPLERYYSARSSGYYFRKYMTGFYPLWIIPYRFGSAILWTFRLLLRCKLEALRSYWKGLFDGWIRQLP